MGGRGNSRPAVQRAAVVQEVLSKCETGAAMARRYSVSQATVSRVMALAAARARVAELEAAAVSARLDQVKTK